MNNETLVQGSGWPDAMIATAGIVFVMVVAVVVIWQIFSTAKAKMSIEREKAYQDLAQKSAEQQQAILDNQTRATTDLAQLRDDVAALHKLLKDVQ